jgi:vitamin B12 transporter
MRNSTLNKIFRLTKPLVILVVYPLSSTADNMRPKVLVTATRTAQTVDDSLASVTVISRDDIENSQAFTVPDILRGVPGLDISSNGGLGKTSSVFMRGTQSGHVLVLVDGIKIGSATLGTVPFQHLPLSQIERIEIVRGPRSSLYGSEAIGGVIQIFTRQWKGKKPRMTVSGGMGADNTYLFDASVSGATEKNWYSLGANRMKTDGFNACQGNNSGGCFTIEPDADAYENTSYNLRLGQGLGDKISLEAHALRAEGHTEYDASENNEADFVQEVLGIKADYVVNDGWLINLNIGQSRDKTDNFGHEEPDSKFETTRKTGSVQSNFFFSNRKTLTVGLDLQEDEVESSTAYAIDSLDNKGGFIEYQTREGNTDWILGFRKEDNEQFGKHTTGNIGLSYIMSPRTRFIAAYGTAFRAPTFNDLYYPSYGNPNLVPEESKSIEIGLKGTQPDYKWSISAYHTRIDKLIASQFDVETDTFFADNINQAKIKGIDGGVNWRKGTWEFSTQFSWLKPEDETTGKLLPRRAESTLKVAIAEKLGASRTELSVLAQSHRYDDAANTQRLGGYTLVNITHEYHFDKHWALRARLENVLDKEYKTASFYNTYGRFWFLSLRYQY